MTVEPQRVNGLMSRMADIVQAHRIEMNDDDEVVFDVLAAMAYCVGNILANAPDLPSQRAAHQFFLKALSDGFDMVAAHSTKH